MTLVNGWTVLTPAFDSRLVYVSEEGDDTAAAAVYNRGFYLPNDSEIGTDPTNPTGTITAYRTFEAAKAKMRSNPRLDTNPGSPQYPDWMLFRRGDKFLDVIRLPEHGVQIGGRSNEERRVYTAWGDTALPRPVIQGGIIICRAWGLRGGNNISFVSLDLPNSNIWAEYGASNILIEDCRIDTIDNIYHGISLDKGNLNQNNVVIRRCVIRNRTSPGAEHVQGAWLSHPDGSVVIEECVFDRNGYKEPPHDATTWTGNLTSSLTPGELPAGTGVQPSRTFYDRSIYASSYGEFKVRGNIFSRGGGGGSVQMREGGIAERNLFIWNQAAAGMTHPSPPPDRMKGALAKDNVVLHDDHFLPDGGYGTGIAAGGATDDMVVLDNNIAAHFHRGNNGGASLGVSGKSYTPLTAQPAAKLMKGIITNNVVYREFEGAGLLVLDTVHNNGVLAAEVTGNEVSTSEWLSMQGDAAKPAGFVYSGNKFHSTTPNGLFRWGWYNNPDVNGDWRIDPYIDGTFSQWQAVGYDTDATLTSDFAAFKAAVGWTAPERDIVSYMQSVDPTYVVDEDVYVDEESAVKQATRQKVWEVLANAALAGSKVMTEARAKLTARRYHAFITFIQRASENRKGSWDTDYTAEAVNNYIREGFGKPPVTGDYDDRSLNTRLLEYTESHGPVASLVLTTQPVGDISGEELGVQPVVTLKDANNLTTTSDNTTQVSVAIQSGSNGTLSGTTTITVVNGVATFTDLVLTGDDGEPYVLRFSIASPSLYVDSANVVVSSATLPATVVKVIREPVASFSGSLFSTQPKIALEDSLGSLVSSDNETQVSVSIISGLGGTLQGTLIKTAVNGIIEFTDLSLTGIPNQAYVLGFSSSGLTSDSSTVTLLENVVLPPQEVSQITEGLVKTSQYFRDVLSIDIDGEFNKSDFLSLRINKTKMIGVGTQDFIVRYRNTILSNRNINYSIPENWDLSWSFKQGPIANPNNLTPCFLWLKPEEFVISSDGARYETLKDSSTASTFGNGFGAETDSQALRSYAGLNSFVPLSFDGTDDYYFNDGESSDFALPTNIDFIFAFVAKTQNTSSSKENVVFSLGRENEDGTFQVIVDETSGNRKFAIQTQASSTQRITATANNCYTQGDPVIVVISRIDDNLYIRVNGTSETLSGPIKLPNIISTGYGSFIGATEDSVDDTKKKFFAHDLYEIVLVRETVDQFIIEDNIFALEGYLAAKYKLQNILPANHAYKNEPPRTSVVSDTGLITDNTLPSISCSTLTATATDLTLPLGETTETITVVVENSLCQWGASTTSNWITLSSTFGIGNGTFDFTVSENTGEERTGTIRITSGSATPVILTVTQETGITGVVATGGTITDSGGYRYHTFTANGDFVVSTPGDVEYLVVGGGGGGYSYIGGGGGGGGGVQIGTTTVAAQTYAITVGSGGAGSFGPTTPDSGSSSSFGSIATGGGGLKAAAGGTFDYNGGTSGTPQSNAGGTGSTVSGSYAGGGGGAGEVGETGVDQPKAGDGGDGLEWPSGSGTYYGGGGGGGSHFTTANTNGLGGLGGGGDGAIRYQDAQSGAANTGGGGGGTRQGQPGNGGSGVVIIRYAI